MNKETTLLALLLLTRPTSFGHLFAADVALDSLLNASADAVVDLAVVTFRANIKVLWRVIANSACQGVHSKTRGVVC